MPDRLPLLAAKLWPPPTRSNLVARSRLIARLEGGLSRSLTLISAPAGFGKTTLLAEWLKQIADCRLQIADVDQPNLQSTIDNLQSPQVAWLSLDEDDNDLRQFLAYLSAALARLAPAAGERALARLRSSSDPSPKAVLTELINELGALLVPFALILDDYHAITVEPIHAALTFLLDHLPPMMRVVIASRVDPNLPLARWRARDQLSEIGAADLRFTPDEAATFLNQVMGLRLSAVDVTTLDQRTEGWIAGLQLAALSVQGRPDQQEFIAAFAGTDRYLAEYLLEEIFNRQPDDLQLFLLRTAICDRLTGALCDALTGRCDGEAMLERLARANLFVSRLDAEGRWRGYHQLFREFLQQQLRQREPDRIPELHRRAAAWFERAGLLEAAIQHALQSGDDAEGARLVAAIARDLVNRDELAALRRWLSRLPETAIWANSSLCLAQIWMSLDVGQPQAVLPYLERVNAFLSGQGSPALQAETLHLRAVAAAMNGQVDEAVALARQAQQMPSGDPFARALGALALGAAYKMGSEGARAEQCLREAAAAGLAAGSMFLACSALGNLGDLQCDLARLAEAEGSLRKTLELMGAGAGAERPSAGWIYWDLGRVHYEWNQLDAAQDDADRSVALCEVWGNYAIWVRGLLLQAQIRQARRDWTGARAALDEAERVAQLANQRRLLDMVLHRRLALALALGDLALARQWAAALQEQAETLPLYRTLASARLCLTQGQPGYALDHLGAAQRELERTNQIIVRISVLALEALARRGLGQREQALVPLERALALAQPGGLVRTFLDEGAPMQELLRRAAAHSSVPDYVYRLLAAFEHGAEPHEDGVRLTERERQILRLLAAGLSNRAIAEQLVITEGTLKRHVSNLFLKLDVHSRTQALARAAELGLR